MDLTDEQWPMIEPLVIVRPRLRRRKVDRRERPRVASRPIMNAILWIMRTGAKWADLPGRYPSYQTCHHRFQQWSRDKSLERMLRALARDLKERGDTFLFRFASWCWLLAYWRPSVE